MSAHYDATDEHEARQGMEEPLRVQIAERWHGAAERGEFLTEAGRSRYGLPLHYLAAFWREANARGLHGETAYRFVCLQLQEVVEKLMAEHIRHLEIHGVPSPLERVLLLHGDLRE